MAPRTLPGLGLSGFWTLGEDGWNTANDVNLRTLSALAQPVVLSRTTALPGSPTNGQIFIVPDGAGSNPNEIAIRDNGAWVYLVPQEGWTAYVADTNENVQFDGTDWVAFAAGGGGPSPYDVPLSFAGTPDAGALMGKLIAVRDIAFEANFSGSAGHVGTNPDATFDIDVQDDGVSIGTISIATGGAFTFTTVGGTAKTVASGSRVEFYGDSVADGSIEDIAATLKGTV